MVVRENPVTLSTKNHFPFAFNHKDASGTSAHSLTIGNNACPLEVRCGTSLEGFIVGTQFNPVLQTILTLAAPARPIP
jgi:hypothetical protein